MSTCGVVYADGREIVGRWQRDEVRAAGSCVTIDSAKNHSSGINVTRMQSDHDIIMNCFLMYTRRKKRMQLIITGILKKSITSTPGFAVLVIIGRVEQHCHKVGIRDQKKNDILIVQIRRQNKAIKRSASYHRDSAIVETLEKASPET